jgi:hypothetical protein
MIPREFDDDDRAVSVAVTHVLTIGITTILIAGLLVGASGLLESEKQGATRDELRTIGNRMASEMSSAYYSAGSGSDDEVVVGVSHPEYVAGNNYKVRIAEEGDCSAPAVPVGTGAQCLILSTPTGNNEVVIPLDPEIELTGSLPEVSGGSFYIVVEMSGGSMKLTLQKDAPSPSLAPMPEVRR